MLRWFCGRIWRGAVLAPTLAWERQKNPPESLDSAYPPFKLKFKRFSVVLIADKLAKSFPRAAGDQSCHRTEEKI